MTRNERIVGSVGGLAVVASMFLVTFLGHETGHAQARVPPVPIETREEESLQVLGRGATRREALENAHTSAAAYAEAVGSSWGRLLRRVASIEEVSNDPGKIVIRVRFHVTSAGIMPETLLKKP